MAQSADGNAHFHKWYVTFKMGGVPHPVIVLLPPMGQQAAGTLASGGQGTSASARMGMSP